MSRILVVAPSLLLVLVTACGRVPVPRSDQGPYAGQTPPGVVPELFAPGLVSGDGDQAGVVVSPGSREIYFWTVENRGGRVTCTIRVTRLVNGAWTSPEVVPFSGMHMDAYLAMHPDGSRMYFQSKRPIDRSESTHEYNLWYVERQGDGWSEARSMGRPVNGRDNTSGASVTADGTLYFTLMDVRSGHSEIYRSRLADGAYQEPERLPDAVNALFQTCDSYVAPDGSYLVFVAFPGQGHTDNPGGLYVSFRDSTGAWGAARDVRPMLGAAEGSNASISPDGRYLFFARRADGPRGLDIYWVSTDVLRIPGASAAR